MKKAIKALELQGVYEVKMFDPLEHTYTDQQDPMRLPDNLTHKLTLNLIGIRTEIHTEDTIFQAYVGIDDKLVAPCHGQSTTLSFEDALVNLYKTCRLNDKIVAWVTPQQQFYIDCVSLPLADLKSNLHIAKLSRDKTRALIDTTQRKVNEVFEPLQAQLRQSTTTPPRNTRRTHRHWNLGPMNPNPNPNQNLNLNLNLNPNPHPNLRRKNQSRNRREMQFRGWRTPTKHTRHNPDVLKISLQTTQPQK